ncbi:MAG: restriction endonuclease subunit S [Bacteroidaceae bacterium]|nr:restriction endonuclease subunit S [Bacteroidaceae bacterium]
MEEWKEYKIGDIAKTNTSQYSLSENWETIQYLDTGSITKNQISGIEEFFGNIDLPSRARRKVKHGDIVYSCVRPNLCHYGYIDNPPANLLVSTGFAVITVDPNIADARYIYYFLTQNNIVQSLHTIGEQAVSTYPSIKASDIEDLSILLPSLPIQRQIASILSSLDDKIELNRKINANLEAQAQALFKSWFVDFEPFKDQPFVESELGMIPEGWRVGTLGEICNQSSIKVGCRNDVKVLSPVTTGNLMLSEEYFTKQVFSESIAKYKVVTKGAFAYNPARVNIGSLGRNEYDFDGAVSPVYVVFECKDGYENFFDLYRRTERFKTEVSLRAIGGVRQSLNYTDFAMIQTVIAPQNVIDAFNPLFDNIKVTQRHLEKENSRLASLRDTLLPRLMSGELKVNEVI